MATKSGVYLDETGERNWAATMDIARGLWPAWDGVEINEHQAALWREHCATLDQVRLRNAVKIHKLSNRGKVPHIGSVLEEYRKLRVAEAESRGEMMRGAKGPRGDGVLSEDQFVDRLGRVCSKASEEASILRDLESIPQDELVAYRDGLIAHWARERVSRPALLPENATGEQQIEYKQALEEYKRRIETERQRPSSFMGSLRKTQQSDNPRDWSCMQRGQVWAWAEKRGAFGEPRLVVMP